MLCGRLLIERVKDETECIIGDSEVILADVVGALTKCFLCCRCVKSI